MVLKRYIEKIRKKIKNRKLQHCIQYADDFENGDTITCRRLEFENFHDYKRYTPNRCNEDMVNFFVKGLGSRNKLKDTKRIIQNMNGGNCNSPYVFNKGDTNNPIETGGEFFLKKQQKLVPRVINPQTNLKGLLVYHGLGSGKTGTSIIVGEACKYIMTNGLKISKDSDRSQNKVLVVVPASLKEQYKQEILGNLMHRKSTEDKYDIKKIIKEKIDTINPSLLKTCFKIQGNTTKFNNSFSKNVLINGELQTYNNTLGEVNFNKKQLEKQTTNLLLRKVNNTYKVVSRQTFMRHFLYSNDVYDKEEGVRSTKTGSGYCLNNFLKKPNGLLIIDEIQNLISETGSWYRNLIRGIKYYCHPTTKILLLTATPIYDKIFEIGLTLNLLNPRIRFPENRVKFDKLFVATSANELNDEEGRKNSEDIKERKSVFSTEEKRIERYAQTLRKRDLDEKKIKDLFKTTEKCYYELIDFLGKVIYKNQMLSIDSFTPESINIIKSYTRDTNMSDFATLFNLAKTLKKQLGLNEYRNSVIKNKDLFEYMCSGYISYFKGGNPKGFPKKITKIIDCKMSPTQANAYIGIVKMEVKKNRDAEASREVNPNSIQQGTYFQKATMVSNVHLMRRDDEEEDEEKTRKELLKRILESPKIIKAQEKNKDLFKEIKSMSLYDLKLLDEDINVETVHHSQNEQELREEELLENIENIAKQSSKNRLRNILESRKIMTKKYYDATLMGIRYELKGINDLNEKLQLIHNKYSCKFTRMIDNILNEKYENGEGKHFIYSRFKTRGVECLSYMLEGFGYKRYTEDSISELKEKMENEDIPNEDCFVVWSGDIMDKSNFSKVFKSIYNNPKNRRGDYLKIVLGTESIMEGVNLKEVKYVHITEPWWNESRMDQVMGRAIRWKSHINMEPEEQQVIIYRYYATTDLAPKDFAPEIQPLASNTLQTRMVTNQVTNLNQPEWESNQIRENIDWEMHKLENPEPISPLAFSSIDRYIQGVAEKKKRLNQMFYKSVKNSAIDCLFNKFGNTYRLEKEFYYDEDNNSLEYYYDPTEHKYYNNRGKELTKEIYGNIVEIKPKEEGKITLKIVNNNKGIFYENIDCNFRKKTGKEFESVLEEHNFSHLLNTEHHNKIKEIIFKIYNEKTSDAKLEEIKLKLKRCLQQKIQNPEEHMNTLNKIFNAPGQNDPRSKIIENIALIVRDLKFEKQFREEFEKNPNMSPKEKERLINIIKARVENSVNELKSNLYEIDSVKYLGQQYNELLISKKADEVYKKMIKKINDESKKREREEREGRRPRRGGREGQRRQGQRRQGGREGQRRPG